MARLLCVLLSISVLLAPGCSSVPSGEETGTSTGRDFGKAILKVAAAIVLVGAALYLGGVAEDVEDRERYCITLWQPSE